MSSFICSDKHFNSIEAKLISLFIERKSGETISFPYSLRKQFPNLYSGDSGYAVQARKEIYDVMDELRRLNPLSVSLQYKHHYEGTLDKEIQVQTEIIFADKKTKKDLTKLGLLNALNCLSYQLELENITELRPLSESEEKAVNFLEVIIHTVAMSICSSLPDDGTNRWSIE